MGAIERTCAVLVVASLLYGAGWVIGADKVLFECRTVGATQILGKLFMCEEPAKEQDHE